MSCSTTPPPTPPSFDKGDLPLPPAKKVAVLACMDARLNPYGILGLSEGDAHVIRNAGGVVTDDEIRSLSISQHLLGTEEIILIHHTGCGMLTFNDDGLQGASAGEVGHQAAMGGRGVLGPRRGRPPIDRPHHRPARSSPASHRCAASSTTSPTAACARSSRRASPPGSRRTSGWSTV